MSHSTTAYPRPRGAFRRFASLGLFLLGLSASAVFGEEPRRSFDIPAGPALRTIKQFSAQVGNDEPLLYSNDLLEGVKTNAVRGDMTPSQALSVLLDNTGLKAVPGEGTRGFAIRKETTSERKNGTRAASRNDRPAKDEFDDKKVELPVFEVMGSKLLNMDARRSRDDVQPYVVFERAAIAQSGANDLQEFLKNRLTMNTQAGTYNQSSALNGNISQVNLRGLGTTQTLILVDGHRVPSPTFGAALLIQPDLNGIPLAAIERIEVLPTTSSGIYGGNAMGGVINVILRRDYAGAEATLTYENTLHQDTPIRTLDLSAGFTVADTRILLAAHLADTAPLLVQDRDFAQRGRRRILANNPSFFATQTNPPVGATTNFRSTNGSALFGQGTPNFGSVPVGYAGRGGQAPLLVNAGRYNFDLADSAQTSGGGRTALLNAPTLRSFTATLRRSLGSTLEAFVDAGHSDNKGEFRINRITSYTLAATAPNNPFGQQIRVTPPISAGGSILRSESRQQRFVGGLIARLPRDWSAEADYSWNKARTSSREGLRAVGNESAPITNGTLDVLRDLGAYPLDLTPYLGATFNAPFRSTLENGTVRVAGPAWTLPGGPLTVSGLVEYRSEVMNESHQISAAGALTRFPRRSQSVGSAYVEAKVPLFSPRNARPAFRELEFQFAARRDDYRLRGAPTSATATTVVTAINSESSSTNPTVGFRYAPAADVALRASYGTGFLPPNVYQVYSAPGIANDFFTVFDPRRGNTSISALITANGGNPNLKPEKSKNGSVGVIFTPRIAPQFRASVDYTRITKRDNITSLSPQSTVANELALPGLVHRGPVPAGDTYGVGPITGFDIILVNITRTEIEAFDAAFDWEGERTRFGRLNLFALATWQTHYLTQVDPVSPLLENVGISTGFPLKFKANAGLTWEMGRFTFGWNLRYFDSYVVATTSSAPVVFTNQGSLRVPSQIYHDVFATVRLDSPRLAGWFRRTELKLGMKNVFDTEPPFDANGGAGLYYSSFGDARLASYYLSLKRAF